ncbi:hypothetical protein HSB1_40250 [Halogranum salarium B-1]|uniref:Uncharacterized protein n=1 Tax=Halogranum salarium B-1 TaxID=1210908 RepID=J3JDP3_9EURY|nr:hypothetical protein HSB1_40250 [Halogranum salarium B-1]
MIRLSSIETNEVDLLTTLSVCVTPLLAAFGEVSVAVLNSGRISTTSFD